MLCIVIGVVLTSFWETVSVVVVVTVVLAFSSFSRSGFYCLIRRIVSACGMNEGKVNSFE
jgi:hypothetical protein